MRRFVRVLKPAPPTDVVNEDGGEVGRTAVDDTQEFLQRVAPLDSNTALAGFGEGTHDEQAVLVRIALDSSVLVFRRVLLVLSGHPDVFCGPGRTGRHRTRRALLTL